MKNVTKYYGLMIILLFGLFFTPYLSYADANELIDAARKGNINKVKELVNKGADVNARKNGETALIPASENGRLEVVKFLIDKGADVNVKKQISDMTPLMGAALGGHTAVVKHLMSKGADVNAKNKNGKTALDIAKEKGHNETIKALEPAKKKKGK